MESNWDLVTNFTVAMLAIVNPLEKIPLWVAAAEEEKQKFQWFLALLVIFSCALILLFFLWLGRDLLLKLHIDLASFKIGGGLILLQFGFSMMKGTAIDLSDKLSGKTDNLRGQVFQRYQQIFIPIGVPVIAGPGAITTVIIYGHQSDNLLTTSLLSLALLAVLTLLLLILLSGTLIKQMVGTLPLELISRVFGLILIAISVQFMVEGLLQVFPGWK